MLAVLSVELRKLNRSLAAVLVLAAPCLIGFFTFFALLRNKHPSPWETLLQTSTGIWAFFMLPMSVTALTALVAQMEHTPRAWDHLRALPVARWKLYAAKAICVVALVVVMTLLNQVITWGAISAASALKPAVAPAGPLDVAKAMALNAKVVAAALLMIAIQIWTALRFASFAPALALGIGGTFFSVVATSAKQGVFFPWQMPVNMLASQPWRVETALALGGGLGLLALVVAIAHLARREVL
ncbi:ABC transporter permease [Caulobacter sp. X]|uniref:ABC transporter permease n=1 Tax=Caulobacter sp. X TaxID=2048901 RepID=UPI000C145BBA|nr:ABC transporter permease [Caulobacter sp. X]PIB95806.1 ABC transporter [Caulobacter sp. X]